MIILHQFPRCWQLPNPSHFCVKLETYLRMADLDYTVKETLPLFGPRGKLPYIVDNGLKIGDSRAIIHYLAANYGLGPDAGFSAAQLAEAQAWRRLLEEHLYWISMYTRWSSDAANWRINKQGMFGALPIWIAEPLALAYRRRIRAQLRGQGVGRLSAAEIERQAAEDVAAVSVFLGDRPYFMGERPGTLDATAYGVLGNIIDWPAVSPLKTLMLETANLPAYCQRMQRRFFPELAGAARCFNTP